MKLQRANRTQAKIKLAIQGPSGSGKTYSSLLLAFGLVQDWHKIAIIDTENHSADLYSHLGPYYVLTLEAPFTPERYIECIQFAVAEGVEALIIDSLSHEWEGSGGILEQHSAMVGNSYTNWSKLTPRHNALIQTILQSPVHIIGCMRSKQEYVLSEKNGKHVPEKLGMKSVSREGTDYEFTSVFELDIKHRATVTKDRTGLFMDKPEFVVTPETGKKLLEWCNAGDVEIELHQKKLLVEIETCKSIEELLDLYKSNPAFQQILLPQFTSKREALNQSTFQTKNLPTNGSVYPRN
jgi:AAA domain